MCAAVVMNLIIRPQLYLLFRLLFNKQPWQWAEITHNCVYHNTPA